MGPSDELDIGVFALESPEQTTHLQRIISREGFISLPWVGDLIIKDLSVRQAEELIKKAYGGRYIKNPQITVQVTQHHSVAVLMTGAVKNPGIFYLTDNQSTLLDMLAKSGGLRDDASDELLLLHGRPADVGGDGRRGLGCQFGLLSISICHWLSSPCSDNSTEWKS